MTYKFDSMWKLKMLRIALVCVSIITIWQSNAQEFAWRASVTGINSDGFSRILLSPEIISKLKNDFEDIRMYDSENKEIPYIFESERPIEYNDYFVEYKIIEKTEQTQWPYYTRLVIHNPKKNDISNIQLVIRNSDVSKSLKLSGSDDNKSWYSIKDGYRFHSMYSDETTSVIKIIDFPVSNYEYYEVLIDDWKNNPINIVKAGYFNTSVEKGKYTNTVEPEISQLELKKEKQSLVKIVFPEKTRLNKITFKVEGPDFYYREAELQIRDSSLNKRKQYEFNFQTISSIVISSNNLNTWYFDNLNTDVIYLRINNFDDAPIKIQSVEAEQLNHYLVCKLEKSKKYTLKFGNQNLETANYDLKYFKDKIPKTIPIIKTSDIKSLSISDKAQNGFVLDKRFIWAAIILVAVFLVYMITRMLKDMKSQKEG